MSVCVHMRVCARTCLSELMCTTLIHVPMKASGHWIPWSGTCSQLLAITWVIRTELRSTARAIGTLNHRAISPASTVVFLKLLEVYLFRILHFSFRFHISFYTKELMLSPWKIRVFGSSDLLSKAVPLQVAPVSAPILEFLGWGWLLHAGAGFDICYRYHAESGHRTQDSVK